jgi:NADH:ubiquinone oxidoreductase subunit E
MLHIFVCVNNRVNKRSCSKKGDNFVRLLHNILKYNNNFKIIKTLCQGNCGSPPSIMIGNSLDFVSVEDLLNTVELSNENRNI